MDVEDLLVRVQHRGRLYGRNESRRAVCAVVEALGEFLSARAFHLIAELLPDEARRHLRRPESTGLPATVPTCRTFLSSIATRLLLEGPDAAFTARVVLEELNATGRVITPARFAHLVAADLRPLLCAHPAPIPADETNPAPRRVIRITPAPLRPAPSPASRPASAAPLRTVNAPAASAARPASPGEPRPISTPAAFPAGRGGAAAVNGTPLPATPGELVAAGPASPAGLPATAGTVPASLPNAHPASGRAVTPPVATAATPSGV